MTRPVGPRLSECPCSFCSRPVPQAGAKRGRYRDAHPECSEIASALRRLWKGLDAGCAGASDARKVELVRLVRSNAKKKGRKPEEQNP